jgi:Sortase domain
VLLTARVAQTTAGLLAAAVVLLAAPSPSFAAEPSNQNDPCSRGGRDTCRTLGVGFYHRSRYGIRWFGDYRGAVAGGGPTFCLDSGFWYASAAYRYRESRLQRLRNREGEPVPVERQQKIAYAIWTYGRSNRPNQQAAVALYVHSLIGDTRPGEADRAALGARVVALYERVAVESQRYHGPYRIQTRFSAVPTVGRPASVTVRVLSAEGYALPDVPLRVAAGDTVTLARTGEDGVALVPLAPTSAGLVRLRVETGPLAATLPTIFAATTKAAAPNAQRLAAPASQRLFAMAGVTVHAVPTLRTAASAEVARRGTRVFDRIRVSGLGRTAATIQVELFGPFATRSGIHCAGRPYWEGTVMVEGDVEVRSPPVRLGKAGFYAYRERLTGSPLIRTFTTACPLTVETTLAAPGILAGGADAAGYVPARDARASRPTRVRVASVGIDAAVTPVGIDVRHGTLGIPKNIHRAGWWKDGSAPGTSSGTILVTGHVDGRRAGEGAFFTLHDAQVGDEVKLETIAGRTFTYRVTSIRSYHKNALPSGIYSSRGRPQLVLVTCGGPFNRATRRYRDNIVVTTVAVEAEDRVVPEDSGDALRKRATDN